MKWSVINIFLLLVVADSETVHILTSLARLSKLRNLPSAKKPATKRKPKQKQTKKTTEQDKEGSQHQHWRPTFEEVQEAFVLHLEVTFFKNVTTFNE